MNEYNWHLRRIGDALWILVMLTSVNTGFWGYVAFSKLL